MTHVPMRVHTQVGAQRFYLDLFGVGMLYHLYNQVSSGGNHGCETVHA